MKYKHPPHSSNKKSSLAEKKGNDSDESPAVVTKAKENGGEKTDANGENTETNSECTTPSKKTITKTSGTPTSSSTATKNKDAANEESGDDIDETVEGVANGSANEDEELKDNDETTKRNYPKRSYIKLTCVHCRVKCHTFRVNQSK